MIWVIVYLGILVMIIVYLWLMKRKTEKEFNESEYEKKYARIQKMIHSWDVNENSYCVILKMIDSLIGLKHKNTEKTEILKNEFKKIYKPISDKILKEADMCRIESLKDTAKMRVLHNS